jgi:hypothetical protein
MLCVFIIHGQCRTARPKWHCGLKIQIGKEFWTQNAETQFNRHQIGIRGALLTRKNNVIGWNASLRRKCPLLGH